MHTWEQLGPDLDFGSVYLFIKISIQMYLDPNPDLQWRENKSKTLDPDTDLIDVRTKVGFLILLTDSWSDPLLFCILHQ